MHSMPGGEESQDLEAEEGLWSVMESTHRSVPTACSGPSLRYEQEGTCLSAFQHKVLMGACQWHQMCALPVPKSHPAEAETVKAPTHCPS